MPVTATKAGTTAVRPAGQRRQQRIDDFNVVSAEPIPELRQPAINQLQQLLGGIGAPGGFAQQFQQLTGLGPQPVPMQQDILNSYLAALSPGGVLAGQGPLAGIVSGGNTQQAINALQQQAQQIAGTGAAQQAQGAGFGQRFGSALAGEQSRARERAATDFQALAQQLIAQQQQQQVAAYLAQIQGALAPAQATGGFATDLGQLNLGGQQLQAQQLSQLLGALFGAGGLASSPAFLEQGQPFWQQAALAGLGAAGNVAGAAVGR